MPKKNKDPFRTLSRRVRASLENSPEIEAFISGDRILPLTWGGYATRAIDMELCEPTRDAVVALLGGERYVLLSDPEIVFSGVNGNYMFEDYRFSYIEQCYKTHLKDLDIEVNRLTSIVDAIVSGWKIDKDIAEREADQIQDIIESEDEAITELELAALCCKRDAISDGINMHFETFAETMLSCNVLDEEFPSELAQGWVSGVNKSLQEALREYFFDIDIRLLKPNEVFVSRSMIAAMKVEVRALAHSMAQKKAEEDWEKIEPVFLIKGTHRTLAGTEI